MAQLTDQGRAAVESISRQYGVSGEAVETMLRAMARGGGTMAQFSHPEFGGSGQWMQGGMTMVSDMFNTGLKLTVENVCGALAQAMSAGQLLAAEPGDPGHVWWPDGLGAPSVVGGQNDMAYAVFPSARRLLVRRGTQIETYDLGEHSIGGVSQQQDGMGTRVTFSSQFGQFDVSALQRLDGGAPQETAEPMAEAPEPGAQAGTPPPVDPGLSIASGGAAIAVSTPSADALGTLERLASLVEKGFLTREEFDAKKAELLARL